MSVCYHCADERHSDCIGVPCGCPCPYPTTITTEDPCASIRDQRDKLLACLKVAQPEFCSLKCPSVFRGPDSVRHLPDCERMRAVIEKAEDRS